PSAPAILGVGDGLPSTTARRTPRPPPHEHNLNRSATYARTTCTTPRGEDGWKSHGHQHDEAIAVEEGKNPCSELETHIDIGDKVLTEFITELGRDSTTVLEFDAKLKEKGADFPDYFVRTLLTIIHAILQPTASNPSSATIVEGPAGAESAKFPGLARPDDPDHARNLRLELERDADAAPPAPMRDDRDRRWDGRAETGTTAAAAVSMIKTGGTTIRIETNSMNAIGRVAAQLISGMHCKIYRDTVLGELNRHEPVPVFLKDTSSNGTFINWKRPRKIHPRSSLIMATLYHYHHLLMTELPKRLLLTYKPEESEDIPELASVEEENAPVEEPVLVPHVTEVVSPPKTEVADTGDLLGLNDPNPAVSAIEESNALALAIVPTDGASTTGNTAFQDKGFDPTGWELTLVTAFPFNMSHVVFYSSYKISSCHDFNATVLDKLELKAVKDGSASYAALEKKAELYEKLSRGKVKVDRRGDDKKYLGKVLARGVECDLALLSVENEEFWRGTEALHFGRLPCLQ
ncbi:hypothetical protein ACJX0J_036377, partial [Zea mays]